LIFQSNAALRKKVSCIEANVISHIFVVVTLARIGSTAIPHAHEQERKFDA